MGFFQTDSWTVLSYNSESTSVMFFWYYFFSSSDACIVSVFLSLLVLNFSHRDEY
jgi:hypothetical protein